MGDEVSINFSDTRDFAWVLSSATNVGPLNSSNWNHTSTASGMQGSRLTTTAVPLPLQSLGLPTTLGPTGTTMGVLKELCYIPIWMMEQDSPLQ